MTELQAKVIEKARAVVANWRKRPHTRKSAQEIKAVQDEFCLAVDAEAKEAAMAKVKPS